ncbi:hypothetical protein BD408DRAFT_459995 [Parasitella parasitica]|nr:hypothetical protein BD408DRAFT_459995 [Parasitella parasitica]
MATNSLSNNTSNSTACSTPECAAIAKSILNDVDLNVDPCSDFYQYTCGSWLANKTIPEDRASLGTFDTIGDANREVMRSILEGTYEDAYKSLVSSDDGFHRQDQEEADKRNFNTMQKYYNVCSNEDQINSLGPTPIYQDIASIENVLFPVRDGKQIFSSRATALVSQTMTKFKQLFVPSLFSFGVNPDDKNPEINSILFDQLELGLPSKEYYEVPETLAAYKAGLNDILSKIIGEYSNGTEDATLRETESKKFNFKRWSNEKVAAAVDRFIDFESKLANITLKADEMQDPTKLYNPIKLSEFQAQNPLVDWTSILSFGLSPNTTLPDIIINRAPQYFERLHKLLSSRIITEQTLQEFFIIKFVMSMSYTLDSTSREASNKMSGAISSGTTASRPRWEICTSYVSNSFGESLGRYYTLKKFGSEQEREKAEVFLSNVHKAWLDRIPELEWLDEQTKAKAIEKVNLIAHKVAYGTVSPDIRQPLSIEKYNEGIYINETSFYETETLITSWYSRKMWEKAGQKVNKDEWYMSPQTVNAYYTPNGNEIVIPAGILQAPFYDATYPDYLNYGGIGVVIGHEITHAFDSSGRKYDGRGILDDWWTNDTSAKFEDQSQCFVDQYSKFNVSGPGNTTLNVNGNLTLGENLADNGGIAAALAAYRKLAKQEETLPGLEHLSPEALFYVNFGRLWCGVRRPEFTQQLIYSEEHSPDEARVNGAVQNSANFAKAFNCPVGSPMNPQKKCNMW